MARFLSQVYTGIRGSVGGITYLSNQYHQLVARARTSPVNPNSGNQQRIRAAFAQASTMWRQLSDADRVLWNNFSFTCAYQGPLGPYYAGGRQTFHAIQAMRIYCQSRGLTFDDELLTPPSIPGWFNYGEVNVVPLPTPGTGFQINVANPNLEDAFLVLERSFAFSPTRLSYKGPFMSSTFASDAALGEDYGAHNFTGLVADYVYFVKYRLITQAAPFRISQEGIIRAVATISV